MSDAPLLKIPPQDLDILSFAQPNLKRVSEWVDSLPKMNVGETSKRLYAAIPEIPRLKIDAGTRMHLLEAVRGTVHYVCNSLARHFLNKPVVLQAKEAKIANLSQALQNHLALGYKVVVCQHLPRAIDGDKEARRACARAIHRAITEMNLVLLRCYQLYFPAPAGYWREIYQLFILAERLEIATQQIDDPEENGLHTTIYDAFRRGLMIATAKPNQLRQHQIEQIYNASRIWHRFVHVTPDSTDDGLFMINLLSDLHPLYPTLQKKPDNPAHARTFDASHLSSLLKTQLQLPPGQQHPEADFFVPAELQPDLLRILIQSWSVMSERAFTRIEEIGPLKLTIGLSSTHYFVSNRQDFNKLIRTGNDSMLAQHDDNPFLNNGPTHRRDVIENHDVWGLQLDRSGLAGKEFSIEDQIKQFDQQQGAQLADSDKYPQFICDIVNTSPGGFCVRWKQDVPPQVKTGEVVGVQEKHDQTWSIGVIRWVKQFRNEGARMGIELLAPRAEACGAQIIQKKGQQMEYMRALVLPELRAIGQAATIITPNMSFAVGAKINLNRGSAVQKVQLSAQLAATASFSQFEYKHLSIGSSETTDNKTDDSRDNNKPAEDDFDAIWSSL